jgi:hypothetical protein
MMPLLSGEREPVFRSAPRNPRDPEKEWRAWSLALASALTGALAAQIYYEVVLEPPPRGGFELGSVVFGAFNAFVIAAPFVLVGALVAGLALALAPSLRRA